MSSVTSTVRNNNNPGPTSSERQNHSSSVSLNMALPPNLLQQHQLQLAQQQQQMLQLQAGYYPGVTHLQFQSSNNHEHVNGCQQTITSRMSQLNLNHPVEEGMNGDLTMEEVQLLKDIRRRKAELLLEIEQLKEEIGSISSEMNHLDMEGGGKANSKQKQMLIGKKKFNMDPKKGIEFLLENELIKNAPEDVAFFLLKSEGLNKTAIGDYLGEKKDFNMEVLDAFINLHDFANLILISALRQFLWNFRLPGEAQKVDRMMEKFAARYCSLNPGVFSNNDTCYVLCFSIIMLNTMLHNPAVKDKPTLEFWIKQNRGINAGQDLPVELLSTLYQAIKQEPFKMPEDDGNDLMHTFFNPDREGWLWKQGGRYKSWKRRWFILNDKCLYYFEYTTDKEPRGIIPLENVSVREVPDKSKPHCFELYSALGSHEVIKACKTDAEGRVNEGKHTTYRMYSATAEERDAWIKSIRQSISQNPYFDMVAARKRKAQLF